MLTTPSTDFVRVIPLGGLDQFGMNCCLIECNSRLLMFDCGLSFPDASMFGIDYILPDWTYVLENIDRLDGIILTHGHEDHIGGLPYLLDQAEVPVYGGKLTLAMVQRKLEEADVADVPFHVVEPGDKIQLSDFELEFIHVNHSIPNAMSVAISTPIGKLLFTGDWKLDQTPIGEPVMDLQRLAKLGEEGLLASLGDSTNVQVPGFSRSETDVKKGLKQVIAAAEGRVIIALFSSNMHRVSAIIETAAASGRRVALVGRSLERNFDLARTHGFVPAPAQELLSPHDVHNLPEHEVLVLTTGSQAEPRSTLNRLAYGDHRKMKLRSTDTVITSARVIPGNETAISKMLDALARRGVKVITARDAAVHGSGHAQLEEIKLMINLTRPKYLVPMHGTFKIRQRHAAVGKELGATSMLINDGDALEFTKDGASVSGKVRCGRVVVDGRYQGGIDEVQLKDRKQLAATGIIVAFAVLDQDTGAISSGPTLMQQGFLAGVPESEALLEDACLYALEEIEKLKVEIRKDHLAVQEALRLAVRRFFKRKLDRKPVVIPIVHEL